MANQQNSYTGSQGTGNNNADFAFTFPSFTTGEVKVEVDNVVKTLTTHYTVENYNTTSGGTVRFTAGNIPTGTTPVRVFRQTDVDNPKATFTAGSSLKAGEINDNFKQVRHALQEAIGALATDRKVQRFNIEADAIDGTLIADDVINSEHYAAGSIDLEHMSANSVDSDQYVDGSIDLIHMSANSVDSDQYVDGSIDGVHIANDQIDSQHYVAGSIDLEHMSANSVDSDQYVDGSIDLAHMSANSVDSSQLVNGCVDLVHMSANSVDSDQYVDGSIDLVHMSANSVDSDQYVDGSIDHVHLSNDCVDEDNIQDDAVRSEHIQANAVTDSEIATGTLDNRYYTETELNAGQLDSRYFTETESDARYFRQDSTETISTGNTWSSSDAFVATTGAIDARIIDLVDDVGGFVPLANETSFPNTNPDVNNGAGTLVSIKALSQNYTSNSSGVITIANGTAVQNSTVTITGAGNSVTYPAGFGMIVETTVNTNQYAFHRLVPKATEVTTVAANAVNIAAAGANVVDINNFADLYQISQNAPTQRADTSALQIGDLWFDSSSNKVLMIYDNSSGDGFTAATPNASDLVNINIVAGQITYQEDLGLITNAVSTGTGNNSVNTVAGSIANVNTAATNIAKITTVADDLNEGTSEIDTVATNIANVNIVGNAIGNVNNVGGSIGNVNTVHGSLSNVNTAATNIASINTTAASIANVNNFTDRYQVASSNPSTDGGGNALAAGDLYFNTSANELKVYTGSAWQGGVTATGSFAATTGNTFTGANTYNDNVKAQFGTGADLDIYHNGTHSYIVNATNDLVIECETNDAALVLKANHIHLQDEANQSFIKGIENTAAVELYYGGNKKLETTNTGATVTGLLTATTIDGAAGSNLQLDFGTL